MFGGQEQAQGDQDHTGDAFGGFPVAFGDPGSQVQAELCGGQGLDGDTDDDGDQR